MKVSPAPSSKLPIALMVPQPLNVATPAAKTKPFAQVIAVIIVTLHTDN
jgi:hypothetical protein